MVIRLALAASWAASARTRAWCVAVCVCAGVAAIASLGVRSAYNAEIRAAERVRQSSFEVARDPDETAFRMRTAFDTVDDEQVLIRYWHRVGDAPVPGVHTADGPGWFLSPRLLRAVEDDPGLAVRYPGARPLGPGGFGYADELAAFRVLDDPSGLRIPLTSTLSDADLRRIDDVAFVAGGVLLVIVPAALLLVAALGPLARAMAVRGLLLERLGASWRFVAGVAVTQVLVVVAPGIAVGAAAWSAYAQSATRVPVVGSPVVAGDLAVDSPGALVIIAGWLLMASTLAVLRSGDLSPASRTSDAVPSPPARRRWLPVVVSSGVMAVAPFMPSRVDAVVFLAGLALLVVSLPVVLPRALWVGGEALARHRRRRVVTLLAGRSLQVNTWAAAAPFAGLAIVLAIVPFGVTWAGTVDLTDSGFETGSTRWLEVPSEVPRTEIVAVADASSVPLVALTPPDEPAGTAMLIVDCDGARDRLPGCVGHRLVGTPFGPAQVTAERDRIGPSSRVFYLVAPDSPEENAIRATFLNRSPPLGNVSFDSGVRSAPLITWLESALLVAVYLAVAALAIHFVGTIGALAPSRARLVLVGADLPLVRKLAAADAGLQVAVSSAIGLGAGALLVGLFTRLVTAATFEVRVFAALALVAALAVIAASATAFVAVTDPTGTWQRESALVG